MIVCTPGIGGIHSAHTPVFKIRFVQNIGVVGAIGMSVAMIVVKLRLLLLGEMMVVVVVQAAIVVVVLTIIVSIFSVQAIVVSRFSLLLSL